MENTGRDYTIVGVEKKVNEIKTRVLNITYEILGRLDKEMPVQDPNATPEAEVQRLEDIAAEEKYMKKLHAEQKTLETQLGILSKTLAHMKKASPDGANPLYGIRESLSKIESALPNIQQKMNAD